MSVRKEVIEGGFAGAVVVCYDVPSPSLKLKSFLSLLRNSRCRRLSCSKTCGGSS